MLATFTQHIEDVSVLRRLLFALSQLSEEVPNYWELVAKFAVQNTGHKCLDCKTVQLLAENLQELDPLAFQSDHSLYKQLMGMCGPLKKPLGVVLMPVEEKCVLCAANLKLRRDRPAPVVVYDDNMGSVPGSHFHKYCTNRSCGCTQYYGYYTTGGNQSTSQVIFTNNWEALPYFVSSRETVFSMTLLKRFHSEILLGQLSFMQCANVYNHTNKCDWQLSGRECRNETLLIDRQRLDRRRVEDAYFQFAVLRVCSWHPQRFDVGKLPLHSNTSNTLRQITSIYHEHKCDQHGCGSVIIIDGNMKNHRDVCLATHAGYAKYKGLPDAIRTGCPNTPALKSRFCSVHKPILPTPGNDEHLSSASPTSSRQQRQPEMVIGKRSTRQGTLYEVVWISTSTVETTWE